MATIETDTHIIEWSKEHETILIEWADKALCFRWMHSKSHQYYSYYNMWFTIPVIVMSTLAGTANFAQERLPLNMRSYAAMAIGSVNIFAGLLTTISQFLKISELKESTRVASISWDKFYRNTKVELAKSPNERIPIIQMLKHSKEEFDRLMETSPIISDKVIYDFNANFSDGLSKITGTINRKSLSKKQLAFLDLIKPDICGSIESTSNIVYNPSHHLDMKPTFVDVAHKIIDINKKHDDIKIIFDKMTYILHRMPTVAELHDEIGEAFDLHSITDFFDGNNNLTQDHI